MSRSALARLSMGEGMPASAALPPQRPTRLPGARESRSGARDVGFARPSYLRRSAARRRGSLLPTAALAPGRAVGGREHRRLVRLRARLDVVKSRIVV